MKDKVCLIVNFYFGDRRKISDTYKSDKLILLKKQIEYLNTVKHNLDTIVFSFNLDDDTIGVLSSYINHIPKKIQNSKVEIVLRKNVGMSYGAWAEYTLKNIDKYDYFIFNEDDYFFVENNFDLHMVDIFKSKENCGYLATISREPSGWNQNRKHAGCSIGMASKETLKIVKEEFEEITNNDSDTYKNAESLQVNFTYCFVKKGLEIYDVRDKFRIPFSTTLENEPDIILFFNYNKIDLINPFVMVDGQYSFTVADLEEFRPYAN